MAFILFSKTQVCLDLLNDNPPSLLYPQDKNPQSRDNADDLQGRAAWPPVLAPQALNAAINVAATLPELMTKISTRAWP